MEKQKCRGAINHTAKIYLNGHQVAENIGDGFIQIKVNLNNKINTDYPYYKTSAYAHALKSEPDIVLINLGTNDTKGKYRKLYDQFEHDYKELINSFRQLPASHTL